MDEDRIIDETRIFGTENAILKQLVFTKHPLRLRVEGLAKCRWAYTASAALDKRRANLRLKRGDRLVEALLRDIRHPRGTIERASINEIHEVAKRLDLHSRPLNACVKENGWIRLLLSLIHISEPTRRS